MSQKPIAKQTISVAHTDQRENEQICKLLINEGYNIHAITSAKELMSLMHHKTTAELPDLMLLSIDIPETNGPSLIRGLRKCFDYPIVILSENHVEKTIVDSLDAGAYDFLTLPFGSAEHFARIRAALRNSGVRMSTGSMYNCGGLSIDFSSRKVNVRGKDVNLTPIEFRILTLLARNTGKVLTHEQIINEIWGPLNSDTLVLRVNMANIRRKLETNPATPEFVLTEMGVGYRMAVL